MSGPRVESLRVSGLKELNAVPKRRFWKQMNRYKALWLMALPGIIYLIFNNYIPMLGVIIAFKNVNYAKGILWSDWAGWDNFAYLFKTDDAFIITRNTILYNIVFIITGLIFAVTLAIMLNEVIGRMKKKFYQSAMLLPYFLSSVIVAYLVYGILSSEFGLINKVIFPALHIEPINWYNEPKYWPYILTIVNAWKGVGYLSVVYIAAILGIDQEYYEAAVIDGASKWQQIRHITLPLIMPVIITLVLLQVGRIFYADFGLFYQVPLESGTLFPVTNVIDTFVYRGLLQLGDIGMSSAAGLYQSVVGFVIVMLTNLVVRKFNRDQALF